MADKVWISKGHAATAPAAERVPLREGYAATAPKTVAPAPSVPAPTTDRAMSALRRPPKE